MLSAGAPRGFLIILHRKGVIRRFRRHILVCYTQVIMPAGAEAFPVVGGGCTGRVDRCKAGQDRHARLTLMLVASPTVVRSLGFVERVRRFLW